MSVITGSVSDTPEWCWNRSPSDDKALTGHNSGSLFIGPVSSSETVINSLQYNISSHLMSDAFPSPLPSASVTESPMSVPSCSPVSYSEGTSQKGLKMKN